jgi:hypothetical protein
MIYRPLPYKFIVMAKKYTTAPIPFMGQKRMFTKDFKKVLATYPDDIVIVDLFGGSGLLSHIAKSEKPNATVVFNDYDNYHLRIENINRTNTLLRDIRNTTKELPRHKSIPKDIKKKLLERIHEDCLTGYVDFITLSSSLLFSMRYVLDERGLSKETLYNNVRLGDYNAEGYLDGIKITCKDYKELFNEYKDIPNVLFLVDPPYLYTDVCTYRMSWTLSDYLDVLTVLRETSFVYFTSKKSSIIELCQWIESNKIKANPFEGTKKIEVNAHMNYNSRYTDIMLYKTV